MRILFLLLFLVGSGGMIAGDPGWKGSLALGVTLPTDIEAPPEMVPFVEAGWFTEVIPQERPQFYDLGIRATWDPAGVAMGVGARHKLYFSPWSSTTQEVIAGGRWAFEGPPSLVLSGRFGGQVPGDGRDAPYPSTSADLAVLWTLAWNLRSAALDSSLGLSVGFGVGSGVVP